MKKPCFLLAVSCLCFLSGCRKNCGPADEPALNLTIKATTSFRLTDLYGLGGVAKPATISQPYSTSGTRTYVDLKLPINLNADQSRYVLVTDGRRDTVMVNYKRAFAYQDTDCGYTVSIQQPGIFNQTVPVNRGLASATLGTITSIRYRQTTNLVPFRNPETNTGIDLELTWP